MQADTQPVHAVAVEHSDAYQTRAKIHRVASYATLPLFAAELALGASIYNGVLQRDLFHSQSRGYKTTLDAAFADIIRELRTQYLLGFYPKAVREEPRRYHPVSVSTHDTSLKISSRSGYYEPN